jgi:hypothetical protein
MGATTDRDDRIDHHDHPRKGRREFHRVLEIRIGRIIVEQLIATNEINPQKMLRENNLLLKIFSCRSGVSSLFSRMTKKSRVQKGKRRSRIRWRGAHSPVPPR